MSQVMQCGAEARWEISKPRSGNVPQDLGLMVQIGPAVFVYHRPLPSTTVNRRQPSLSITVALGISLQKKLVVIVSAVVSQTAGMDHAERCNLLGP
jgi:hypothetical protein